ncbi:msp domain-containing protein [Ophiostoma piceae UAMH 11346]|uniref:Msp domain-containing protein n=1 Tax=Ophiostoma piceae (strain UAMH 11346) TaxID=1262450 RepID=S3BYR5_OPHP1|nr:msp domain-containing protein [Ophiostoma piceae UAMH 11346]
MSVDIEPTELGFRRPFTVEVSETLRIRNPNSTPIAFKVKTTAPKQYCVRPNSGRIEPDREVEVSVLLQAMKQDPPHDFKCRDKFLVQSVPITGDKDFTSVTDIWDQAQKSDVQEKKIRVIFLTADDPDALAPTSTPARPISSNGFDATPEAAAPSFTSPREESRSVSSTLPPLASSPESKPLAKQAVPPSPATPPYAASKSGSVPIAAIPTANANDKDTIIAALKAQLAESQALNSSLRSDGGLRQRKVAADSSEKSGATESSGVAPQLTQAVRGTEGVSVQVVSILCLLSFLLAYFFF